MVGCFPRDLAEKGGVDKLLSPWSLVSSGAVKKQFSLLVYNTATGYCTCYCYHQPLACVAGRRASCFRFRLSQTGGIEIKK